ncbi:MAG: hypothetical protein IJM37_07090 [Lachnospiraceae bacterium]|nr:hypothetical protein [Lachnospiraceae bacterium]
MDESKELINEINDAANEIAEDIDEAAENITEDIDETAENIAEDVNETAENIAEDIDKSEYEQARVEAFTPLQLEMKWHEEDMDELINDTFNHSTEVVRKDTKPDMLLTAVGVFALLCFIFMLIQCIRNHKFDMVNYICLACYIIIALIFIPKPLQCFFSNMLWKLGKGRFSAISSGTKAVTFNEEKASFSIGSKDVSVAYKYMESIFETEKYFVLMPESKRILTFAKADMSDKEIVTLRTILAPYL